jgi:hypothetical protein
MAADRRCQKVSRRDVLPLRQGSVFLRTVIIRRKDPKRLADVCSSPTTAMRKRIAATKRLLAMTPGRYPSIVA